LVALRSELNEGRPVKISVNDLIIKAAARAHELLPAMNVVWTDDALREFHDVDISVAIASPRGLVTPTLRAVQKMSIGAVSAAVKDFVQRAGDGKLRQDELEGGALSVSNLGMFGTESFSAIINPPQSAILAVGAIREEAVVQNRELKVGQVMRVTLSVDHRAIDGAQAAQWLSTFLSVIEKPLQILS
jgi:pyruvate dehydrogenase E2 component (dihydrolipoamide acetyltransferase)